MSDNSNEQIPVGNFYKRKDDFHSIIFSEKMKRIANLNTKTLQCESFKPMFLFYIWQKFPSLAQAYTYIKTNADDDLRLFAKEKLKEGESVFSYIVTNLKTFWYIYMSIKSNERHFYEVILVDQPCKLYMDVEFEYLYNPGLDGHSITLDLINFIAQNLKNDYVIEAATKDFLWLDSSSQEKYSCHIVMPELCLFSSNIKLGDFLKICEDRAKFDCPRLFVMNRNNQLQFVADLCVYSRNRIFRLYLSNKMMKGIPLVRSPHCKYMISCWSNDVEYDIFIASLVIPLWSHKTCVVDCSNGNILNKNIHRSVYRVKTQRNKESNELEKYLSLKLTEISGCTCFVKLYFHSEKKKYMHFNVRGTRYCHRIGREHKSNQIYLILNLLNRTVYQMCYDFECKNFISDPLFTINDRLRVDENHEVYSYNLDIIPTEEINGAVDELLKSLSEGEHNL